MRRRFLLSKYKRAKQKWFGEQVLEYEIFYYDAEHNERIVSYNFCEGLSIDYPYWSVEGKSLFKDVLDMEDWEIYFKYRRRFNSSDPEMHGLRFSETRKILI